jgi:hypothetical protein
MELPSRQGFCMVRRMRSFWPLCVVLLACGSTRQTVVNPCAGKPATGALGECPPCQTDADCELLSNLCDMQAYCVHKDSSWVQSNKTCTEKQMWQPPIHRCRCLANTCDWSN